MPLSSSGLLACRLNEVALLVSAAQMHRVVISRQAPDAMLGLPGALCVMGSSREKGHEVADIPIHVFAPPGTGDFLSTLYEVRCCCP